MNKLTKRCLTIFLIAVVCVAMLIAIGTATSRKVFASADTESYPIATPYAITEQTGLGLGINVVKAKRANDFVTGYSILNPEKIPEMPTSKITWNKNESITHSTAQISDIIADYKLNFDLGGKVSAFIGSLQADLKTGLDLELGEYTYKYYNVFEHNITRYNLYLNDYLDYKTYTNYFSDNFLVDLADLKNNKNYYAFFDKYGTHIVGSANFGGKLTASYTLASNKIILNEDLSTVIGAQVKFDLLDKDISGEIAAAVGDYLSVEYEASDLRTSFYVNAIGGDSFAGGSIDSFSSGYSDWAKSFNGNDNNSVVMDYGTNGLVPVWEILPASYNTLSAEMKEAFNEYYDDFRDNIIAEFASSNNTTDFAGGSGSKNYPFLIADEVQLRNIETVSMRANYKLKCDIDLKTANWEPLGGLYMKESFDGSLDGHGKTIRYLSRASNITAKDHRFYFGLFGYIGKEGTVKNIVFDAVEVHITGPKTGDSSARVFIGVLAGIVKGTVENIAVLGECFYDVCVSGNAHVGGIAGCAYTGAKIINCHNNAHITSGRYSSSAGGILGYSAGAIIQNCTNYGNVLSRCTGWGGYAGAGGIVGNMYDGSNGKDVTVITSCANNGKFNSENYPGGITKNLFKGNLCGHTIKDLYTTL